MNTKIKIAVALAAGVVLGNVTTLFAQSNADKAPTTCSDLLNEMRALAIGNAREINKAYVAALGAERNAEVARDEAQAANKRLDVLLDRSKR